MPSFLSKVFGRRKHDEHDRVPRTSDASLLEGKFEAISPTVSPTATHFAESLGKEKEKERDGFFGIARSRSRPSLKTQTTVQNPVDDLPHLTLSLPGSKDASSARALGVVFEADPDSQVMLADSELGQRRLNPAQTLKLVKACSQVITARGLETLGIMHPHWYSASPDVQRKLISLFVQSLDSHKTNTLSPVSPSDVTAFESELNFTRSPHDAAAVLRWGLRHLKLDGTSFGKDSEEWSWYTKFSQAERQSSYPPKAYSDILARQLVPAHLDLLSATLEIFSSLAAHAEANSISGSKLSKFLGFWLLCTQRTDPKDDWSTFYARWERAGCILEHLFLARIRDEALSLRMPTRLLELVQHYPYTKGTPSIEFLPRPKFSTRQYDALFVRIETEVSSPTADRAKLHPIRLIVEAIKAQPSRSSADSGTWDKIKAAAIAEAEEESITLDGRSAPSSVFADETVRFLSLLPAETPHKEPTIPKFTLLPPTLSSSSHDDKPTNGNALPSATASTDEHSKPTGSTASPLPQVDVVVTDWTQFTTAGFHDSPPIPQILAGTYLDKDVEKTVSAVPRKPSKKRKAVSPARGRRSLEGDKTTVAESTLVPPPEEAKPILRSAAVTVVQLDEAFIDFWSDALLDPIASTWPNFVICKLKKPISSAESNKKPIEWLVIEHVYRQTAASLSTEQAESSSPLTSKRARPSSPKPSFRSDLSTSRMSSTIAATKKRFSFLANVRTSISSDGEKSTKGRKKVGKAPKIGEMGEILSEEEEERPVERVASVEATSSITTKLVEPRYEVVKPPVVVAAVAAAGIAAVTAVEGKGSKAEVDAPFTPPKIVVEEIHKSKYGDVAAVVAPATTDSGPDSGPDVPEKDFQAQGLEVPERPAVNATATPPAVASQGEVVHTSPPVVGVKVETAAPAEFTVEAEAVQESASTVPVDDDPTAPVVEDVLTEPASIPSTDVVADPNQPDGAESSPSDHKPQVTSAPTIDDVELDEEPEPEPHPTVDVTIKQETTATGEDGETDNDTPVVEHTLSEVTPVEEDIAQEASDPPPT